MTPSTPNPIGRYARWGVGLVIVLIAVVGVWGASAQIAGAVIAPGQVAVESDVKRVQHKEGGIVSDLMVREGDYVEAGAVLVRLDAEVASATLRAAEHEIMQLTARRARLEAERAGRDQIARPTVEVPAPADFAVMLQSERELLRTRSTLLAQQKARLAEQAVQTEKEIEGLSAELASLKAQRALIEGELTGIRSLYERGFAPLSRLNGLEREREQISGREGQLVAATAKAQTRIAEIRLTSLQTESERLAEVMADLKDAERRLAELAEQRIVRQDERRRTEITAPTSGYVQELAIHTARGVIAPGETLMVIVPDRDALIVEARLDPRHIDQVTRGRPATVRFTAFSTQTSPELKARVDRLSTDVRVDEATGVPFYLAQLSLKKSRLPGAIRDRLVPGMPAEVHISTTRRSALSYFLKPLTDQLNRTMREE